MKQNQYTIAVAWAVAGVLLGWLGNHLWQSESDVDTVAIEKTPGCGPILAEMLEPAEIKTSAWPPGQQLLVYDPTSQVTMTGVVTGNTKYTTMEDLLHAATPKTVEVYP